jgi:ACT domain-containing protein
MFFKRSDDKRSSYYKFIDFLTKIEQKEAKKEKELILTMINNIKQASGGKSNKQILMAERAVADEDYGLAYFFLV